MLNQWWFSTNSGVVIPAGLIIPFNDIAANIPAGWSQWTAAANRAIRADSSTAGSQGGNTGVGRSSNSGGSHTGSGDMIAWSGSGSGSPWSWYVSAAGSHSHSSHTIYYTPARRYQIMMKASAKHARFPVKTGILSDVSLSSLASDITPTGYLLSGASGASSSNNASSKSASGCNATGSHDHYTGLSNASGWVGDGELSVSAGAHDHSLGTPSVSDNINRFYLGMWANASAEIAAIPGMYGIWESSTAPEGWAICDGNNGTPDIHGKHIALNSSSAGTSSGNGTITTSGSLVTRGGHHHAGGSAPRGTLRYAYHLGSPTHSHTISSSASSFSPQYHTAFIIKCIG